MSRIVAAITDADADVSRAAARACGDMPAAAAVHQGFFAQVLRTGTHVQRQSAARAVAALQHECSEECAVELTNALVSECAELRREACLALAEVLPSLDMAVSSFDASQSHVVALARLRGDDDARTRRAVAEALGATSAAAPDVAASALAELCGDNDWGVRSAATDAIGHLPEEVVRDDVLDAASGCLSDPQPDVRLSAARVFGRIDGGTACVHITKVASLVDDMLPGIRRAAIKAVVSMWPHARRDADRSNASWHLIRDAVQRRSSDPDEDVRRAAVRAMARLSR